MRKVLGSLAAAARLASSNGGAGILVFALAAFVFAGTAEAKPTGWQSESEIKAGGASAWSGYGAEGYVGRPAKSRAGKAAKSKALKSYASSGGWKPAEAKGGAKKRYAAIDTKSMTDATPSTSLTGGGIRWAASSSCLNGTLSSVVSQVAASYGRVTVNSTCRSKSHNAAVGGARRSHHLSGDAVDFRVHGNVGATYAFLRSQGSLGGVKHYGGGLFHIDTGPKRSW